MLERTREPVEERGFTLVEVLIALAILGISLGVVLTTVSDSLNRTRRGERELIATSLAQSLLARAGADAASQSSNSGEAPDGFSWAVNVTPWGEEKDREFFESNPVTVEAVVSWEEADQQRSIRLKTMKLFPMEEKQ